MIDKRYLIEYPNGVKQTKICIDHNRYLEVKSIEDDDEYRKAYKELSKESYFTSKSLFAYAILNNGYFECYGGPKTIKISKINE